MSRPLPFGHSYGREMLRNKVRLTKERVTDLGRSEAGECGTPGVESVGELASPPNATRIS